jgi:uncharacterized protein (DUF3084 family)
MIGTPDSKYYPKRAQTPVGKAKGLLENSPQLVKIDKSLRHLKDRQLAIDETERVTSEIKSSCLEDQRQIEQSWSFKLDALQTLQDRVQTNEDLAFAIDELSEDILMMKSDLEECERMRTYWESEASSVNARLDRLYEIHPDMEMRVSELKERKRIVEEKEVFLAGRRQDLKQFEREVRTLEDEIRKMEIGVGELEGKTLSQRDSAVKIFMSADDVPRPTDMSGDESENEVTEVFCMEAEEEEEELDLEEIVRDAKSAIGMGLLKSVFDSSGNGV